MIGVSGAKPFSPGDLNTIKNARKTKSLDGAVYMIHILITGHPSAGNLGAHACTELKCGMPFVLGYRAQSIKADNQSCSENSCTHDRNVSKASHGQAIWTVGPER